MLDDATMIEARYWPHPMETASVSVSAFAGQSIAEIVGSVDASGRYGVPRVAVIRGGQYDVVPLDVWSRVRPKPGTFVHIYHPTEGPAAALLPALISAAAPAISATFFGGSLLATAAITVVGGLLVNALIPPPPQQSSSQDKIEDRYGITGIGNAENRYGVYPKVLGRRRIFPAKSARGYTETVGTDVYFRGRFTFGWGPLALENLRIGETPIWAYDGLEIEMLNVDEAQTLTYMPDLAPYVGAWRTGTQALRIYPDDVSEVPENVLLEPGVWTIRYTREDVSLIQIDLSFPQGLVSLNTKGDTRQHHAEFHIRITRMDGTIVVNEIQGREAESREPIRFTLGWNVAPGQYEVSVARSTSFSDDPAVQDRGYLTALRTHRNGGLPSHPDIAEIAIRVKASEQLNGQIDSLNAVVRQMAPVWDGASWSAAQVVRHPAWIYADAIRGPHLRRPVPDSRIDRDALKAWADEEPHWTCDYVVDSETRLADVLDVICATGRAKRALTDLRYSVIRDGASGPVRQVFTPRNSWGFKGRMEFPREIHALRCMVTSERLDWEQDEVTVYADGYDASTASEFETLELPGVVLGSTATTGGNAWRLGRYHLAQAILRPEQYEWHADWEHMRVTRGDLVRIVHDVPVVGIGAARIQSTAGGTITLDEAFDVEADDFRLTVRTQDGDLVSVTATAPEEPATRAWTTAGDLSGVESGDLVVIEETTQESLDVLVTGIYPDADETARLTGVPAAPEVLEADQGVIPPYDPIITPPRNPAYGPAKPVVQSVVSDETTMEVQRDGSVRARVGVVLDPIATAGNIGAWVELRWRQTDTAQNWSTGGQKPIGASIYLTGPVVEGRSYDLELRAVDELGRSRGWVSAGPVLAQARSAPPSDVEGFAVAPVNYELRMQWEAPANTLDLSHLEIRYSASEGATWNASVGVDSVPWPTLRATAFARAGTYLAKWVDGGGRRSVGTALVYVSEDEIAAQNAVETFTAHPTWSGTLTDAVVSAGEVLLVETDGEYPSEGFWESDQVTDLGAVYPCRIRPFIEAIGFSPADNVRAWGNIRSVVSIWPSDPDGWRVEIDVAASEDDPTGGSDWKPLGGGTYVGRYFRFRARLYSTRTDTTPVLTALDLVIDMPDRVEGDKEVTVPTAGLRIDFAPAFTALKSVNVTLNDAPTGSRPVITNKSRTGFYITVRDSGGSAIESDIDWQALGYGREKAIA